jgi:hypothetical protein
MAEMANSGLAEERFDERARVRGRARALGFLADSDLPRASVTTEDRARALESTRGFGPILEELIADGL